ncbi:hypothetical protein BV898_04932 [Hypsibius exemplaris]|uniref:Uncharacterized protein n=1 Tax=Hypsibius exemplaris TaxID=2072580 RepID=A0A1W0X1J8_HYPEX|nr:hypothetical protein BV898_04932 [Hypsibius exemplaris]
MAKLKAEEHLENSNSFGNFDKSGFALGWYTKVYAPKEMNAISFFDGDDRNQMTVLACRNAADQMLRVLIPYDSVVMAASRAYGTDGTEKRTDGKISLLSDTTSRLLYINDLTALCLKNAKSERNATDYLCWKEMDKKTRSGYP